MATEPLALRLKVELVDALQTIDGTGEYHHDFAAFQVRVGLFVPNKPPADPSCCALSNRASSTTLGGGTMTGHTRVPSYLIQGWAKSAADTADARADQAMRMEADILRALNTARLDPAKELYSAATEFTIETQTADGQELGLNLRLAYVELLVTITARMELGEGY